MFIIIDVTFLHFVHCLRNPPKIFTKDGSLVLKAGEEGDIIFEPGQGKQVFIGKNALVSNDLSLGNLRFLPSYFSS